MNETQQDQYLQAQKLIAEEKWQEASDILEDLINEVDDSEIGRLTIIALYHSQQYTRACTYLFEYLEVMFDSLSDAQIAIKILCQNELFVLARQVISSLSQWQEDLLTIVTMGEENLVKSTRRRYKHVCETFTI